MKSYHKWDRYLYRTPGRFSFLTAFCLRVHGHNTLYPSLRVLYVDFLLPGFHLYIICWFLKLKCWMMSSRFIFYLVFCHSQQNDGIFDFFFVVVRWMEFINIYSNYKKLVFMLLLKIKKILLVVFVLDPVLSIVFNICL